MTLIPILVIGGIFVVFYLYKDKFMAGAMASHNEAMEKWQDKDAVIKDFFSDENKFGLLQKAVGESQIEALCWGRRPKNAITQGIKKGAEALIGGYETFDMNAYYLAIADGKLHYLCSNGKEVTTHEYFALTEMKEAAISYDSDAMKVAKYILKEGGGDDKTFKLTFNYRDEKQTFTCQELIETFAKFTVGKNDTYNRKMGQNPFYRSSAEGITRNDNSLMYMYMAESLETFKQTIQALS